MTWFWLTSKRSFSFLTRTFSIIFGFSERSTAKFSENYFFGVFPAQCPRKKPVTNLWFSRFCFHRLALYSAYCDCRNPTGTLIGFRISLFNSQRILRRMRVVPPPTHHREKETKLIMSQVNQREPRRWCSRCITKSRLRTDFSRERDPKKSQNSKYLKWNEMRHQRGFVQSQQVLYSTKWLSQNLRNHRLVTGFLRGRGPRKTPPKMRMEKFSGRPFWKSKNYQKSPSEQRITANQSWSKMSFTFFFLNKFSRSGYVFVTTWLKTVRCTPCRAHRWRK